jgi:hypothetical protein
MDDREGRMQLEDGRVTSGSMATFSDAFKQHGMKV